MTPTTPRPPQLAVLPDPSGLLASIIAFPLEDTPRLEYADWLQEQGEQEEQRANLIRVQCQLAQIGDPRISCSCGIAGMGRHASGCGMTVVLKQLEELKPRAKTLTQYWREVLSALGSKDATPNTSFSRHNFQFDRGFLSGLACAWGKWLRWGDLLRTVEWVPLVEFTTPPESFTDEGLFSKRRIWIKGRKTHLDMDVARSREELDSHGIEIATALALCRIEWPGTAFRVSATFGA